MNVIKLEQDLGAECDIGFFDTLDFKLHGGDAAFLIDPLALWEGHCTHSFQRALGQDSQPEKASVRFSWALWSLNRKNNIF